MQHTNGLLYGTTSAGGSGSVGTVYSLDLGLSPFVSFVIPRGKVGGNVEIPGQGFTGTTSVSFHSTSAAFTVVSDTYLTATVPNGATSGPVVVTAQSSTLASNTSFQVG